MKKHDIQAVLLVQTVIISLIGFNLADQQTWGLAGAVVFCILLNLFLVSWMPRTSYDD